MVVLFEGYIICVKERFQTQIEVSVMTCKARYVLLTLYSGMGFVNKLITVASTMVVQKSSIAKYM
jgi:hypothetical protein